MEPRDMPIEEFNALVRSGKITDAMISTFGDGYGEPYIEDREVIGTLDGCKVKSVIKPRKIIHQEAK